jgi:Xaa-Pro aminopeptidase
VEEFKERLSRAQAAMEENGLDAMFFTTEANVFYYSGFVSQFWQSPTRPFFCVVPRKGQYPTVVVPGLCEGGMKKTWIPESHIKSWAAPAPVDDGITLLKEAFSKLEVKYSKVGIPMGQETSVRMPLVDLHDLEETFADRFTFTDCTLVAKNIRNIKSPREFAKMRTVCQMVGRAFENFPLRIAERLDAGLKKKDEAYRSKEKRSSDPSQPVGTFARKRAVLTAEDNRAEAEKDERKARSVCPRRTFPETCATLYKSDGVVNSKSGSPGDIRVEENPQDLRHPVVLLTEKELQETFRIEAMRQGVDAAPYVIAQSGTLDGYPSIVDGPHDSVIVSDDSADGEKVLFAFDIGCKYHGYSSDYTDNYELVYIEERVRGESFFDSVERFEREESAESLVSEQKKLRKVRHAHQKLYDAEEKAIEFLVDAMVNKKDVRFCDLWKVMAVELGMVPDESSENKEDSGWSQTSAVWATVWGLS